MQNEDGPISPFCILHSSFCILEGVTDGTRTRDVQDHNLALCQLSYGHREYSKLCATKGGVKPNPSARFDV